ncbi:hypothetical protein PFICI_02397 [Pestalotiopsis fici W106-1]|uniref:Protein RTA1 n=1 Tax=Pestalotiopsis fici (strain W106-1 / CGMCC3.15140) TaxID=1229662 RepID=W3XG29_PESFW|nr:uncharacterized protein PFICI_02397 [Pestalotiopsis fici W106-1]ETS84372.1 hypothetical protein PFICI_02397 [Pestalotiopsis fici W106-1]
MSTCNPDYENASWSLYRYAPSAPTSGVFCILFGLTTILHLIQMCKTKTWYLAALVVGAACECIGYAARVASALEEPGCWSLGPYVVQSILILIAPAFFAASIYMILGRIIVLTDGECYSVVKRRLLTRVFVGGDVLSLLTQSNGSGMMAIGGSLVDIGEYIVIAGLSIQLAFFGAFVVVAAIFQHRMHRQPTPKSFDPQIRWRKYLMTLYVTSGLILVRSLFRVAEYISGNDGVLMRSEAYTFVFDSVLMLVVLVWLNWYHPSEIGLLLRGEQTVDNGLKLVSLKRRRSDTVDTCSSNTQLNPSTYAKV